MATDRIEEHPEPPANLHTRELPLVEIPGPLFRIHRVGKNVLFFGNKKEYRFDAAKKEFGVMYLSTTVPGAFVETLWKFIKYKAVSEAQLQKRNISSLSVVGTIKLVDLTSPLLLALLEADARLATGDFYGVCQRWSSALYLHSEGVDGIFYPARHDMSKRSIALYERAKGKLDVSTADTQWLGDTLSSARAEIISTYQLRTI